MQKKTGIFYLTYDGIYNFASGIGTQTRTLLEGLYGNQEKIREIIGDFELNVIVPSFDHTAYRYDEGHLQYSSSLVSNLGGQVFECSSEPDSPGSSFWTVSNWENMCTSSAGLVLKEASNYSHAIVIAVDTPFLLTPKEIVSVNLERLPITSVLTMYTSTFIHDPAPLDDRLRWERMGMRSLEEHDSIKIADVCEYMTDHFKDKFGVQPNSFVPYHSSLNLSSFPESKPDQERTRAALRRYGIPMDQDIIFAFGRASWVKGFEVLLQALPLCSADLHLVLIASEFVEDNLQSYLELIDEHDLSCTLLTKFDRNLPSILSQYERCRIVVCPSLREPFSNIPLEVALWAENAGPVLLASNIGGFVEQITDGHDGFLFAAGDAQQLAKKIDHIAGLPDERRAQIRRHAGAKVRRERDFVNNFKELLLAVGG